MPTLKEWLAKRAAKRVDEDEIDEPISVRIVEVSDSNAARQNLMSTGGRVLCTEDSASSINTYSQLMLYPQWHPMFTATARDSSSTTLRKNTMPVLIAAPFTLVGGALADMELVPALATNQGCLALTGLVADSADTYILTIQDEDNAALPQLPSRVDVVVGTAYVPTMFEQPLYYKHAADNKAIEVDISGGAGTETGTIYGWYWYET